MKAAISFSGSVFPPRPVLLEGESLPDHEKIVTSESPHTLFPHGGSASPLRDMGAIYSEWLPNVIMNFLAWPSGPISWPRWTILFTWWTFTAAHERHIFDELMKRGPVRETQETHCTLL
jgi:hypothetical protein